MSMPGFRECPQSNRMSVRRTIFSPVSTSISTCTGCRIQAFTLQNLKQIVRPAHHLHPSQHIDLHLHVQQLVAVSSCRPARSWRGAWAAEAYAFPLKPSAAARLDLDTVDTASAAAKIWGAGEALTRTRCQQRSKQVSRQGAQGRHGTRIQNPDYCTPPPRRLRQRTRS